MQNDRETGQTLRDLFQNVEAELRIGAGLELVCAVAGADGDGQRITAGALDKLLHVLRTSVGGILFADIYIILDAGERTQLSLNDDTMVMRILDDLTRQSDVVLKGFGGGVDHDGRKAVIHAGFAKLKRVAVIEMQANRETGLLDGSFDELDKIGAVGIFARAGGNLQNNGCAALLCSFRDALNNFHIIHIKSADGVSTFVGFFKHFFGRYNTH